MVCAIAAPEPGNHEGPVYAHQGEIKYRFENEHHGVYQHVGPSHDHRQIHEFKDQPYGQHHEDGHQRSDGYQHHA